MRHTFLLLLMPFLILAACSPSFKEVVEEQWDDGSPRLVKYYAKQGDSLALMREISYYANGQTRYEGTYQAGERHGYWVYFYENGNKWSEGTYVNGREDQRRSVWYPNGQLNYEGMFQSGERVGVWRFWDEAGTLLSEIDYGGN